jgi:hypothetical protein
VAESTFYTNLIAALRAPEVTAHPVGGPEALLLADDLERVLADPSHPDFDLPLTGNDDSDRRQFAESLTSAANGPNSCAPPWTRTFSMDLAYVLAHGEPVTCENLAKAHVFIRHKMIEDLRHRRDPGRPQDQ